METNFDRPKELAQEEEHAACSLDANYVLTWEEVASLTAEPGKPAETLMNVVALIARRFGTEVCSAYLLEPDRANLVLAATLGLRRECVGTGRIGRGTGSARGGRAS
jgi:starch phosphorylase